MDPKKSLLFTPRMSPGERRLREARRHLMHASEDKRPLPEEERDGHFQGEADFSGGRQGKPESGLTFQVNSNDKFREPGWYSNPVGDGRKPYDPHMAELDRQRAREKKERQRQQSRAFSPMRASEDKKPEAAPQNPQRPPYNPADKDIVRPPGEVAPTVKEQLQREIEWNRRQGYTSDSDLTLQQKYERDNLMRDTFQPKPVPKPAGLVRRILSHVDGDVSYEGTHPGTGDPPSKELRVRVSLNPSQRGEMPPSGPPEKKQEDEANRKFLYPAESPEGTQEPVKPLRKRVKSP